MRQQFKHKRAGHSGGVWGREYHGKKKAGDRPEKANRKELPREKFIGAKARLDSNLRGRGRRREIECFPRALCWPPPFGRKSFAAKGAAVQATHAKQIVNPIAHILSFCRRVRGVNANGH